MAAISTNSMQIAANFACYFPLHIDYHSQWTLPPCLIKHTDYRFFYVTYVSKLSFIDLVTEDQENSPN